MARKLTQQEREKFLAEPRVGVISVAREVGRPPSAEQLLAIVRRYLREEMAQGFVAEELARPGPGFGLFTIRPDHWLTNDFSDETG